MSRRKTLPAAELKAFLDENHDRFNNKAFIANDPIAIPHRFSKKEDIEIAGFFAASIAWGNRKSILTNAQNLMQRMDEAPFDFVVSHSEADLKRLNKFVHRTFNASDCRFFVQSLKTIYLHHGGLESAFGKGNNLKEKIYNFRQTFLQTEHAARAEKHISNPMKKSSAKRLCMYLRWMVRRDKRGVDFGLWQNIAPADLCLPLDVHTGNVGRALGLLKRRQNDWEAVEEITKRLRQLDAQDPVKYDFALFGLGVSGLLKP